MPIEQEPSALKADNQDKTLLKEAAESVTTLEMHAEAKQAFMATKEDLRTLYEELRQLGSPRFDSEVEWDHLIAWAFDPEDSIKWLVFNQPILSAANMQSAYNLSEKAFEVLKAYRHLMIVFRNLPESDKQTFRSVVEITEYTREYNPHFYRSKVSIDVAAFVAGVKADQTLKHLGLNEIEVKRAHLYNEEVEALIKIRFSGLTEVERGIERLCFSMGRSTSQQEILMGMSNQLQRLLFGPARDNGDDDVWVAGSSYLNPFILTKKDYRARFYIADPL